jgi:hypothetical protein
MRRIMGGWGGSDGAEIAEVALVLPVVFTFLLGIIWFGRAFQIYSVITQAAQQGAVTAARSDCATCGGGFPDNTTVANAVYSVMDASSLDRTQIMLPSPNPPAGIQSCPDPAPAMSCGTSGNISICKSVWLNPSGAEPPPPAHCGVIVSFQYPFQFSLPFTSLNMQQVLLKTEAQSRMEN